MCVAAFSLGHTLRSATVSNTTNAQTPTKVLHHPTSSTISTRPPQQHTDKSKPVLLPTTPTTTSTPQRSPPPPSQQHKKKLLTLSDIVETPENLKLAGRKSTAACVNRGMQDKCHMTNLHVHRNQFTLFGPVQGQYPNPIYPPDGMNEPLIKYHKYRGHKVSISKSSMAETCTSVVSRLTIFLYRMSGHSTYHLWENNLGPFYDTLQTFDDVKHLANNPKELVVVYVDDKPAHGPKAPHLLDTLLQTFTNVALVNASTLDNVCFENVIIGTSSRTFDHFKLLHTMMKNVVGHLPEPLPAIPIVVYSSRNHKSVTRGRKVANEEQVLEAINATLKARGIYSFERYFMQDYDYPTQVEMSMATHILISPHGGGIANCIWMPKGAVVVEFVAPVGKTLTSMYHAMCGRSAVSHMSFIAKPDPADAALSQEELGHNPRLFSNVMVPPEMMIENVEKALTLYEVNRKKYALKG